MDVRIAWSSGMTGTMRSVRSSGGVSSSSSGAGAGLPSRAGRGVALSSGAGVPFGEERGVGSLSSMRWERLPRPVGR